MYSFEEDFASEVYVDTEFFPRITNRLYEMQRSGTLCDAILVSNNATHSVAIHRCVLAANSPSFCALLGEAQIPIVTLMFGNAVVVESIINYMYSGRLWVSLASARDLLKLGRTYTIGNVVSLVEQHLCNSLCLSTWIEIFRIGDEFQLKSLAQRIGQFLAENVDKILEGGKVEQLDEAMLRRVLTGLPSLHFWNWQFQFIFRWCERYTERVDIVDELLDLVDFEGLDLFSLTMRLEDETVRNSFDALRSVLKDCLRCAKNSTVKIDSIKISADEELAGESYYDKAVSDYDENGDEQLTSLKKMDKHNSLEETSEGGSKRLSKCSEREGLYSLIKGKCLTKSRKAEVVSILSSQQHGDQEKKLSKSSANEPTSCNRDNGETSRECEITSSSDLLQSITKILESKRPLRPKPGVALQLPSSAHVDALAIVLYPNSTTVPVDDPKKPREVHRKRTQTATLSRNLLRGNLCTALRDVKMSSDGDALAICPKSTTVPADGPKKPRRIRGKRAKTEDEMYVCPMCPKRFPIRSTLHRHMKGHGSDTSLLCEICGFSTRYQFSMTLHRQRHFDEIYVCPTCQKQFPTDSTLRRHMRGHGSDIALLCEVCGFSTRYKCSMTKHRQTHFGKNFHCRYTDCKFSAVCANELEDHHNVHDGIKSNVCSICGNAYYSRRYCAQHEKLHLNPKKYSCSKCEYYTGRRDKLREHDKRRHQPKPIANGVKLGKAFKTRFRKSKGRRKAKEKHQPEETL